MKIYVVLPNKTVIDSEGCVFVTKQTYFSTRLHEVIDFALEKTSNFVVAEVKFDDYDLFTFLKDSLDLESRQEGIEGSVKRIFEIKAALFD